MIRFKPGLNLNKTSALLLLLMVTLLALQNNILIALSAIGLIIFYLIFSKKLVLIFVIVSFLTITREISPALRDVLQIFNFSLLIILFLKRYGLNFQSYPKIPHYLNYFIFLLLFLMLLSSFNSSHTLLGLEKFITLLSFLLLVYLIFGLISSDSDVSVLLYSIIICSSINFTFLFWKASQFSFNLINLYQNIFTGESYIGKNNVGVLFSLAIIFLTSLIFNKNYSNRKYLFILITFNLLGLLITDSRASIFSLLISILVIVYMLDRKILLKGLVSLSILTIIIMLSPFGDEILLYLRVESLSTGREYLINATLEVIKHNFVLGAGPAGTKHQLYSNLPYLLNTPPEWLISRLYYVGDINQTHNFYLFFFSDLGIGGFLLSIALPVIYFAYCKKILKHLSPSVNNYYLVIGLFGSGIFIFTRGLVEQMNIISYGHIYYDLPFWVLITILTYYYNRYVESF